MPKKKKISMKVRREVILRDKGICQYCGAVGKYKDWTGKGWVWMEYELDHVIPESLGGSGEIDNIVVACRACNRKKGNKTLNQAGMQLIGGGDKCLTVL